jgi:4'-phosphopantetheinyl transferase EntD
MTVSGVRGEMPVLIEKILPASVVSAEAFTDPADVALFPEEAAAVANAVDKRRREFATGRNCARVALGRLGVPPVPIVRGERGAPVWPAGIVGSITHCDGYRGVAVARDRDVLTVGIDAEPNEPLPNGVLDSVSLAAERTRLALLDAAVPGVCWDRLLFSAKESVYKAWFPITGRWLGFEEADVTIHPDDGGFEARLLAAPAHTPVPAAGPPLTGFTGRWLVSRGLIATAIVVPGR